MEIEIQPDLGEEIISKLKELIEILEKRKNEKEFTHTSSNRNEVIRKTQKVSRRK